MTRNPGGRPEVGPKVELRLPAETLAQVDADANRQQISRAQWLRDAVHQALPYDCLTPYGRHAMSRALYDIDGLAEYRNDARDVEVPVGERVIAGVQYAEAMGQMHEILRTLLDTLPVQAARDAYRAASASDPEMTVTETAEAWARAEAVERIAAVLDAVSQLLPPGAQSVRDRADLDDPMMDLSG
ncbi:ribbon-helix-helix protein, CopG family [Streptomyces sp. AD55]|uniref:ribbon-helix-helix protein, CopG family n=1 Tax=Streptomyces sp. AD55 TaxID=3242895 RepID=UPI003529775A